MGIQLLGWRGPAGSGGGGLPSGQEGQLVGYGAGGTPIAVDPSAASLPVGTNGQVLGYGVGGVPAAVSLPAAPTWTTLAGKPATFPAATHSHLIADVTGLQAALDGKASAAAVLSTEQVQDLVGAMFGGAHSNATVAYDDATGAITISAVGGSGGGLTQEQAEDIVAALIDAGSGITAVYDDATSSLTIGLSGESFTTAEQTKLAGIASGATVNATDAQLRDRATHTGTQAISTVNGLQLALDAKAPLDAVLSTEEMQDLVGAMFTGAHTNATVAYDDATGEITISATGGAGGGSNLTLSDVPGPLTAPYVQSATLTQDATEVDLPTGYISQIDVRRFGAQMIPFGQDASEAVATANRTALQAALDWSSASGGVVSIPGGRLDIFGSLVLPIGGAVRGMAQFSTQLRQRQRPTSLAESFTSIFTAPPVVGAAGGNGFNVISDMMIDGGWNIRNFEGAAHANWAHDPARMTQVAIQTDTPANGPVASASRPAWSDAQSRFQNLTILNVAGTALDLKGRGEIMVNMVELGKSGKHGLDISAPDCFINMLTSYTTGDSSAVIRAGAGNLRMTNSKFWFTGMQSAAECVGAGIHLPDQGTTAIEMHAVSTQDTWGPGLDLAGSTGIFFSGDIDEAGGGRTTQQGFGYAGARTLSRSCVRLTGTLRRAEINARIRGGNRNGAANRPALVDFQGSAILGCKLNLNGDLTYISTTPIVVSTGYTNARRYNTVDFVGRRMHGAMTKAQLDDPTHGVNDALYGPTEVTMTDGRTAKKNSAGTWVIPRLSVQITQAAYDALTPKDPDTDYFIVG